MSLFGKNEGVSDEYAKNQQEILYQIEDLKASIKNLTEELSKKQSARSVIDKGPTKSKKKETRGRKTKFANRKDIADYYLNHTLSETASKFNISGPTVSTAFVNKYGDVKSKVVNNYSDAKLSDTPSVSLAIDADN